MSFSWCLRRNFHLYDGGQHHWWKETRQCPGNTRRPSAGCRQFFQSAAGDLPDLPAQAQPDFTAEEQPELHAQEQLDIRSQAQPDLQAQ